MWDSTPTNHNMHNHSVWLEKLILETCFSWNTNIFHQNTKQSTYSCCGWRWTLRFSTPVQAASPASPQPCEVFAGVVYTDLTFKSRSPPTPPPHRHHRDRVAGRPSYMAGQRGVPSLIGTAAVTHRMGKWQGRWLRGMAPGSVPPVLAQWKGRDGEPCLSAHWSRASPPLAVVRAKGQLRPTDGSYGVTHSPHTRGVSPCRLGLCCPPPPPDSWWPHEDVRLRIATPSPMGSCILQTTLARLALYLFDVSHVVH